MIFWLTMALFFALCLVRAQNGWWYFVHACCLIGCLVILALEAMS